jgi:hypothetical protein
MGDHRMVRRALISGLAGSQATPARRRSAPTGRMMYTAIAR